MSTRNSVLISSRSVSLLGVACTIALCLIVFGAAGAAAQESGYGSCVEAASTFNGCTAKDLVGFESWQVLDVVGQCTGPTSTVQVLLQAAAASTSQRSDDLAVWVNVNGGSALSDLTANACYRQVLNPVVATPFAGLDLAGGHGPYMDLDGDYCGDIKQNEVNYSTLERLTLPCADSNNDGAIDVSVCLSYAQNAQQVCNGYLDALPGTNSKCACSTPLVPVTTLQMAITKSCTPTSIPSDAPDRAVQCTVTYTNNSTIAASNFSVVDDYDQTKGAVSNIGSTVPGANPGTDNGDTITWLLPTVPAAGSGSVTYTYTVNADLPVGTTIENTATLYFHDVAQDIASFEELVIGAPNAVALSSFAAAGSTVPALAGVGAIILLGLGGVWAASRRAGRR